MERVYHTAKLQRTENRAKVQYNNDTFEISPGERPIVKHLVAFAALLLIENTRIKAYKTLLQEFN